MIRSDAGSDHCSRFCFDTLTLALAGPALPDKCQRKLGFGEDKHWHPRIARREPRRLSIPGRTTSRAGVLVPTNRRFPALSLPLAALRAAFPTPRPGYRFKLNSFRSSL